jgi:hypothetical protein
VHENGVAVGVCLGDGSSGDRSTRADSVFSNDSLPKLDRKLVEGYTRKHVGAAACCKWHERADPGKLN